MFKPKQNFEELQIKTAQVPLDVDKEKREEEKYRDDRGLLNPANNKIIIKEKFIRRVGAIFWGIILLIAIIAILLIYFLSTVKDKSSGIALYIIFSILILFALFFGIRSLINFSAWKRTEANFRRDYKEGETASNMMFVETYKNLSLKGLRLKWIYIFFSTYFILFNLYVFIFWKIDVVEIGAKPQIQNGQIVSNSFYIIIHFARQLDKAFGSVKVLLIIDLVIEFIISVLFVAVLLYDHKRIQDISAFFGSNEASVKIAESVSERKRKENRAWLITYIIIFILIVLIPFAWILFLIYRRFIRRKK
ncbi:hypothetical protein BCF59_0269 [Mycoplasmopsis mustelae]|uniref:Uncharacterized protein n=1 Tax=Mycoplasmopsis mustelae TaxID=171289 RepID=A0A4V3FNY8_9BACT|nr:hypothetical protein [Mycoplasmopsis mustelae]TDV24310.1 hypothetical protein BCF59_0269 [Mycoplasmopsis mustelae]